MCAPRTSRLAELGIALLEDRSFAAQRFIIGRVCTRRGQAYEIVDVRPWIARDGRETKIYTLETRCPNCGSEFTTTAGPMALERKRSYLTRRCEACRSANRLRTEHQARRQRSAVAGFTGATG